MLNFSQLIIRNSTQYIHTHTHTSHQVGRLAKYDQNDLNVSLIYDLHVVANQSFKKQAGQRKRNTNCFFLFMCLVVVYYIKGKNMRLILFKKE